MAKRGVTYELDTDERKMIDGFRTAITKAKQLDQEVTKSTRSVQRSMDRNATATKSFGRAMSGIAAAAGGTAIFGNIRNELTELSSKRQEFEKDMTGLLSLGSNVDNIADIKGEVLALSTAFDQSRGSVAEAMFTLQSSAGNLSDTLRNDLRKESLELAEATGTDLATSINAMVKLFQIYGDETDNAADLQNKLFLAAEQGSLTFADLATQLPDVASASKAMGVEFNTLLGSLIVATQRGGDAAKTITGLRNVFLRMPDAQKRGIDLTGTFIEKMQQISELDPIQARDLFGAESLAVAASLASATDQLATEIERLDTVSGDLAQNRIFKRFANDPDYVATRFNATLDRAKDNDIAAGGSGDIWRDFDTQARTTAAGARQALPYGFKWLSGATGFLETAINQGGSAIAAAIGLEKDPKSGIHLDPSENFYAGVEIMARQAEAAGHEATFRAAAQYAPDEFGRVSVDSVSKGLANQVNSGPAIDITEPLQASATATSENTEVLRQHGEELREHRLEMIRFRQAQNLSRRGLDNRAPVSIAGGA